MIVRVRGTVATDVGVLVISMSLGWGKCTLLGKAREVVWLVSMVRELGLDEWCSVGWRSWAGSDVWFDRESFIQCWGWPWLWRKYGEVPGGVGTGGVPLHKSGVGMEVPHGAQADLGKTQRDKILEAVEASRLLLGQGVCSQVEDLIQDHIPPPPKFPSSFPY